MTRRRAFVLLLTVLIVVFIAGAVIASRRSQSVCAGPTLDTP